jgi:hypothetical protein
LYTGVQEDFRGLITESDRKYINTIIDFDWKGIKYKE